MIRQLQTLAVSYATKGTVAALSPRGNGQLHLVSAKLTNNSGGACDLGIFRLFKATDIYSIATSVSAVITDVTAAINAGTATTILTTTNNDGFYAGATDIFGLLGFTISQAETGTPVYTYKYWNGSSWVTLNGFALPTAYTPTGTQLIVFAPPVDWKKGGTGLNSGKYWIQVLATTAPATAVQVTAAWMAQMVDYAASVANGASFSWAVTTLELALHWGSGEGLLPYFGTANAKNMVTAQSWAQEQ